MPNKGKETRLIRSEAFNGTELLDWEDLEMLREHDLASAVTKVLSSWDGKPVGVIALTLANDTRNIDKTSFNLLGTTFTDKPKVIALDKLFPGSGVKLHLSNLDFEAFKFANSLTSAFVDSTELETKLKLPGRNGKELSTVEAAERGVGPFTTRLHCYPIQENALNVYLMAFPLSAGDLNDLHPEASSPSFPGIELCKLGQVELGPLQSAILGQRSWGQPVLPLIIHPSPFDEETPIPSSGSLRSVLASILRSGSHPSQSPNWKYLKARWAAIAEAGEEALHPQHLPALWPEPRQLTGQLGKHHAQFAPVSLSPPPLLFLLFPF